MLEEFEIHEESAEEEEDNDTDEESARVTLVSQQQVNLRGGMRRGRGRNST